MSSVKLRAGILSTSAALVLSFCFSALAATSTLLQSRVKTSQMAVHGEAGAAPAATVIADDWEQVPAGGDSSNASDSSAGAADSGSLLPSRGRGNARVTIIEYTDYQCPACRAAEPELEAICSKYGNQVSRIHKDFPLNFHHGATNAAIAARCAGEQGQFWPYHDALLNRASDLSVPTLKELAAQLNLNPASFDSCLDNRRYASAVQSDESEGDRNRVDATPTLFVNGRRFRGMPSVAALDAAIAADLRLH